jgi:hypothetical protein
MVLVTAKADIPGLGLMDLHGSRLYALDEARKIRHEKVIFLVTKP